MQGLYYKTFYNGNQSCIYIGEFYEGKAPYCAFLTCLGHLVGTTEIEMILIAKARKEGNIA